MVDAKKGSHMQILDCRSPQASAAAAHVVSTGGLIVLPTDTVYGIGADPRSPHGVERLLHAKGRGRDKPSPVLVASIQQAESLTLEIPETARRLMERFWPGALTIVLPAREELGWDLGETGGTVAVRMPDDPFTLRLLTALGPLAVSSANLTGEPPAVTCQMAEAGLGERVDLYLDGGSRQGGIPSSIVRPSDDGLDVLREGALSASLLRSVALREE